nr:MAG TPA: hypothetical protein [Caudoviricetes sp.]
MRGKAFKPNLPLGLTFYSLPVFSKDFFTIYYYIGRAFLLLSIKEYRISL